MSKSAVSPRLIDLPDTILANVASFLVKPSQAIFAVAMTAPSSTWCVSKRKRRQPSAASRGILERGQYGERQWEVLDFEDIDRNLASKLMDHDLRAILLCIDSVNKLEKLMLAGCVNITGRGLEPLRGSVILKQIDLSLVGRHESPHMESEPIISEDAILPILSSIIEKDGRHLRQLQLPKQWCGYRNRSTVMDQVLRQYNSVLDDRLFCCGGGTHTSAECFGTDGDDWIDSYARQGFTCYKCLVNICDDTAVDVAIKFCQRCEKSYCEECLEIIDCVQCSRTCCPGCMAFGGDSCDCVR